MLISGVLELIFAFFTAFLITFFAIPPIINIAKEKNLYDEPGERHSHERRTPSLGGIAIFAGVIFAVILWTPASVFSNLQFFLCSCLIVFLIGIKDDIFPLSPTKKLAGQILAVSVLVFFANLRLTTMHGLFGIYQLPLVVSIALSVFTILVIINSFNLIDGINGLSGSIGILISIFLGSWFLLIGQPALAIIGFSLAGGLIGFLWYNITPAKIFMGDSGSLLLGLICSFLIFRFIELHDQELYEQFPGLAFQSVPAVSIGILILPLFDTLRVFTMRILKGKSPLHPDRNHIHHLLIDCGFSHMQATGILVLVNIFFILVSFYFQNLGSFYLIVLIFILAVLMTGYLYYTVSKKNFKQTTT